MHRGRGLTGTIVAAFVAWAVAPGGVGAQPSPGAMETYGTDSEIAQTVTFAAFVPQSSGVLWNSFCNDVPGGGCASILGDKFFAGVTLPAGARVIRIELDGCDSDNGSELQFGLIVTTGRLGSGNAVTAASAATGVAATPGCALFDAPLATPLTVDNVASSYLLYVRPSALAMIGFTAVRVYYTLQVSAAPAAASFGDVPTSHPFFQFVEALVASGITAGCGGGNYCPDAPLTRGQMAVFLSKGLGLHFAP